MIICVWESLPSLFSLPSLSLKRIFYSPRTNSKHDKNAREHFLACGAYHGRVTLTQNQLTMLSGDPGFGPAQANLRWHAPRGVSSLLHRCPCSTSFILLLHRGSETGTTFFGGDLRLLYCRECV